MHNVLEWRYWLANGLITLLTILLSQQPLHVQSTPSTCLVDGSTRQRIGINVVREGHKQLTDYAVKSLGAGWYIDYQQTETPARMANMDYAQMIRPWQKSPILKQKLGTIVAANRGALWFVGNEPDNKHQDRQTPSEYAIFYHDAYDFLKEHDSASRVAIAAISTVTPLRLRYLNMVLQAYQAHYGKPLPVDVWTMHDYILPETEDWGAGIPPGLAQFAGEGRTYTMADHDNLTLFKVQVRTMRQWMAAHGYRDKPLIVSEFGILLAPVYGYNQERVRNFMWVSFDFLLRTTDPTLGYRADGNRLVQQFAWFSLNDYAYDAKTGRGLNGNLFDHDSGQITPLGRDFIAYTHCQK